MSVVNGTIAAGADDGQLHYSGGWLIDNTGQLAYFGRWSSNPEFVWLRFTLGATIPSGATIDSANLACYGYSDHNVHDWWAYVTESGDAPNPADASYRPSWASSGHTTTYPAAEEGAGAFHDTTGDWAASAWNTKDIKTLIQHLVDTYGGLASGAHIVVWLVGDNALSDVENDFEAYDFPDKTATLQITYSAGGVQAGGGAADDRFRFRPSARLG